MITIRDSTAFGATTISIKSYNTHILLFGLDDTSENLYDFNVVGLHRVELLVRKEASFNQ